MNTNTKNPMRFAAALALFAALTAGAQANNAAEVYVKYADLNVNTQAGAAVLYQRIRFAADQVCGVPGIRDLARLGQAKACVTHAVAEAVAAVNAPALTGLYEGKMGAAPVIRLAAVR